MFPKAPLQRRLFFSCQNQSLNPIFRVKNFMKMTDICADWHQIPFHRHFIGYGGLHISIVASIAGQVLHLLVDTGASHSILDHRWFDHLSSNCDLTLLESRASSIKHAPNQTLDIDLLSQLDEVKKAMSGGIISLTGNSMPDEGVWEIDEMIAEEALFPSSPWVLTDMTPIRTAYQKAGLLQPDGLLGSDLLSRMQARILYSNSQIQLYAQWAP
jgi:hypothetical protein